MSQYRVPYRRGRMDHAATAVEAVATADVAADAAVEDVVVGVNGAADVVVGCGAGAGGVVVTAAAEEDTTQTWD